MLPHKFAGWAFRVAVLSGDVRCSLTWQPQLVGTLEAAVGVHSVGSGTWGLLDQLTLKQSAPMPAAHSSWGAVPLPGPSPGPGVLHKAPPFSWRNRQPEGLCDLWMFPEIRGAAAESLLLVHGVVPCLLLPGWHQACVKLPWISQLTLGHKNSATIKCFFLRSHRIFFYFHTFLKQIICKVKEVCIHKWKIWRD